MVASVAARLEPGSKHTDTTNPVAEAPTDALLANPPQEETQSEWLEHTLSRS